VTLSSSTTSRLYIRARECRALLPGKEQPAANLMNIPQARVPFPSLAMRSELHRNHVTDAQTVHENLNDVSAGTHEVEADNSGGDMPASLGVVLHWLGSAVVVAFIALAIIEPERVERALTPLMFKAPNGDRIQIANVGWSAVEMAKSDDRVKQIDAEHKFEVIDPPPQVTDDFDQRSRSQTDTSGSAPIPTSSAAGSIDIDQSLAIEFPIAAYEPHKSAADTSGSAPIPTSSAAGSIDIDQSLAIEFPIAAYEPHKSAVDTTGSAPVPTSSAAGSIDIDQSLAIEFPIAAYEPHKSAVAMKRHPLPRAKVAAKRSVSNNPQANSHQCKRVTRADIGWNLTAILADIRRCDWNVR
jgi:hypothetical protein